MGRWAWRLFEGDQDLDLAAAVQTDDLPLFRMVNQTDMMAPQNYRNYYQTPEYALELQGLVEECRVKLDKGAGKNLLANYRKRENEDLGPCQSAKYRIIIVGALLMRAGAKIPQDDLDHMRQLANAAHSSPHYANPMCDLDFRDPGKMQFLAALDHYQPGVPRSFSEPSCFACGKIEQDKGTALLKCGRCKEAWYCDKECQARDWKVHKVNCARATAKPPMGMLKSANV